MLGSLLTASLSLKKELMQAEDFDVAGHQVHDSDLPRVRVPSSPQGNRPTRVNKHPASMGCVFGVSFSAIYKNYYDLVGCWNDRVRNRRSKKADERIKVKKPNLYHLVYYLLVPSPTKHRRAAVPELFSRGLSLRNPGKEDPRRVHTFSTDYKSSNNISGVGRRKGQGLKGVFFPVCNVHGRPGSSEGCGWEEVPDDLFD